MKDTTKASKFRSKILSSKSSQEFMSVVGGAAQGHRELLCMQNNLIIIFDNVSQAICWIKTITVVFV